MADDDDIEALLREIDRMNASEGSPGEVAPTGAPAPASGRELAESEESGGSRLAWAGVAAIGSGAAGFVIGLLLWFLPWISAGSTAVGAAIGGALVALLSGPPRWFGD